MYYVVRQFNLLNLCNLIQDRAINKNAIGVALQPTTTTLTMNKIQHFQQYIFMKMPLPPFRHALLFRKPAPI